MNFQRTSTGINMLPNIVTYIGLGFKPVSKNEKNVFFEKDLKNPLSRQEIRDFIKEARKGNLCNKKENKFKEENKSGLSLEEQRENSGEFNGKLYRENRSVKEIVQEK